MVQRRFPRKHIIAFIVIMSTASGCTSFRQTVPGYCVGDGFYDLRSEKESINFLQLRQEQPEAYLLGPRDILGVYIEGVLGTKDEPPPVHFPEEGDDLPPAIGYPMPVRDDGTISLPLIEAIEVDGLTVAQAEHKIRNAYIQQKILRPDRDRIIVTLMKARTYHVLVVREDEGLPELFSRDPQRLAESLALQTLKRGMTHAIELRAYENDVLHALSETGGLPGNDALNEVIILRSAFSTPEERDQLQLNLNDPDNTEGLINRPNVIKIPLRVGPKDPVVQLSEQDIILDSGDIVFVRSRETEVFYTGGLLPGGQWPIPRDYDIDVLQAMAMAGGNVGSTAGATERAFMSLGVGAIFPPTRALVLREICGEQVAIEVSLKRAMVDPSERILIQPGDFIVLEYRRHELILNVLVGTFRVNAFLNTFN